MRPLGQWTVGLAALVWAWQVALSAEGAPPPPAQAPGKEAQAPEKKLAKLIDLLGKYEPKPQWLRKFSQRYGWSAGASPTAKDLLNRLGKLSDDELERVIDAVKPSAWRWAGRDLYLTEIIRRGGKRWERDLHLRHEAAVARWKKHLASEPRVGRENPLANLELLTALRRVQKANDPIMILVAGTAERTCKLGYGLPVFDVRLTNVDVQRQRVGIEPGGDYRGRRRCKWRIEIRDKKGRLLPTVRDPSIGGFLIDEVLNFGESWTASLRVDDYVEVTEPGEYTLRIFYHNRIWIAEQDHVEGLICCRSIPIRLVVEPIRVEVTAAERKQAAAWIARLPDKGPVKVHGGAYGEESADFIPPDSPCGKLLEMDWKAVGELIKAANCKAISPKRRAWVLGVLYGITGKNDPCNAAGVLGPYVYRHSGWTTLGGPADSRPGMSFVRESREMPIGKIDPKKQLEFAKRWLPWIEKGYVRFEDKK